MAIAHKLNKYFTYEDYLAWELKEGERFELIDGVPYAMASPNERHQSVSRRILRKFFERIPEGDVCKVYHAPFDVRLKANKRNKKDDTVVQPDIIVVCDPSKIDKNSIKGAPDMVIEILSPSTVSYDVIAKFAKYREAGVKEIWYVDPEEGMVIVHILNDEGNYITRVFGKDDKIAVNTLEGFVVDLSEIFMAEV